MEEWIFKLNTNNNWEFYIYFFNLIIIALLNQAFPKKISHLIDFLNINKNVKTPLYKHFIIEPFNIGSFLIISCSISLFFYKFFEKFVDLSLNQFDFFYIYILISSTLIIRFFLVKSIFSIFAKTDDIEPYFIRVQLHNTLLCVIILIILLINEYSFLNKKIILGFFITVFLVWVVFNILSVYRYIKNKANEFLYLIFYLCAVKITPWLWIYHSIYETRIKFL
tara:strand:+ start:159 stop:827 length:669 start_codon:yes stop_codon:yes gene_type:complete